MNQWDKFLEYPPPAVRLFARRHDSGRAYALTDQEIAVKAGLSVDRIREITMLDAWSSVPLGEIQKYCQGCRFDILSSKDRQRAKVYVWKVCNGDLDFSYLKRDPERWANFYQPLMARALNALKTVENRASA